MYFYLDIPLIWAYQHLSVFMYDLNMIILYIIFPFSTKVLDTVLKWLCLFIIYYVFFLTHLWYIIILLYIKTQREVQFLPIYGHIIIL